jgi:uncharacterized membrane protein YkgB
MPTTTQFDMAGTKLERIGGGIVRYGLALVLGWIGALKFTAYEAKGIAPLVSHSPLMSWAYSVMSMQAFSMLIGVVEITLALLIVTRAFAPKVSAIGSLGAALTFLVTLSFLLTTPAMAVFQPGYGFPALSPMPGQFLLKDIVLLGASVWSAGEALLAARAEAMPDQVSREAATAGAKR